MAIPFIGWNETIPENTEAFSLGDERIRELKSQIRELISIDHYMPVSIGQDDMWGYHNRITLLEGSSPTAIADTMLLYTKEIAGKSELHCKNEDGTETQLTSKGNFIAGLSKEVRMWSGTLANIPTGWFLCDGGGSPARPNLIAKFIQGIETTVGATGGNDSITLTVNTTPRHTHVISGDGTHVHDYRYGTTAGSITCTELVTNANNVYYNLSGIDGYSGTLHTHTTSAQGSNTPYNNRPAYVELAFICR